VGLCGDQTGSKVIFDLITAGIKDTDDLNVCIEFLSDARAIQTRICIISDFLTAGVAPG